MKKKVLFIVVLMLILIFTMSLVSCSDGSTTNNGSNNTYNPVDKPNVPSVEVPDDNDENNNDGKDDDDIIIQPSPFDMAVNSLKEVGRYDAVDKEYELLIPIDSTNDLLIYWDEINNTISILFTSGTDSGVILTIDKNLGPKYAWAVMQGKYLLGGTVSFSPYTGENIKYLKTNIPDSMSSLIPPMKNLAKAGIKLCCSGFDLFLKLVKLDLELSDFNIYITT